MLVVSWVGLINCLDTVWRRAGDVRVLKTVVSDDDFEIGLVYSWFI